MSHKKKPSSSKIPLIPFSNGLCGSSILLKNIEKVECVSTGNRQGVNQVIRLASSESSAVNKKELINIPVVLNIPIRTVVKPPNGLIIDNKSTNMHLMPYSNDYVYYVDDDSFQQSVDINMQTEAGDSSFPILSQEEVDTQNDISMDTDSEAISEVIEAFKCKRCNFTTLDRDSLVQHNRESHYDGVKATKCAPIENKVVYVCGKCSKAQPSIKECRKHMIKVHQLEIKESDDKNDQIDKPTQDDSLETVDEIQTTSTYDAIKWDEDFWNEPKTVKEVIDKLRSEKMIRCTFPSCIYRFNTLSIMIAHRACHTAANTDQKSFQRTADKPTLPPYTCTACSSNFSKWSSCSLHLWREHSVCLDLLVCPQCPAFKTYSASKLVQHMARHWQKTRKNTANAEIESETPSIDDKQLPRWYSKYRCEFCDRMLSDCKSLKKHIQKVHKKIKPFICQVCNHASGTKNMLQLHMRQHTGDKPFVCKICSYRTGDHNTLRRHHMKHTGERPYKCPHCTYACIQSVSLKYHLKSAHSNKQKVTKTTSDS